MTDFAWFSKNYDDLLKRVDALEVAYGAHSYNRAYIDELRETVEKHKPVKVSWVIQRSFFSRTKTIIDHAKCAGCGLYYPCGLIRVMEESVKFMEDSK